MKVTKDALRKEIKQLREVGGLMANVLYNLKYRDALPARDREICKELSRGWDAIERAEK